MATTTVENGQTCLEKRGIEEREEEISRSRYTIKDQYGPDHLDALAKNEDPQGKGSGHGGHTAWQPDCTLPTHVIRYSNFDTTPDESLSIIGGLYDRKGRNDIGGREKALQSSLYNYAQPYGADLVKTTENVLQGQYRVGDTIKNL